MRNKANLDPFLGGGTVAVCCKQLNLKWIGIEKEKKYCNVSINRILEGLE